MNKYYPPLGFYLTAERIRLIMGTSIQNFGRFSAIGIFLLIGVFSMMSGCSREKAAQKESLYLTERGNSAISATEWDDAVRFFTEAITKNPANTEALYGRSSVRMATGKEFYLLARAAANEGEYTRAREIAVKADRDFGLAAEDAASILKIDPNAGNAYYILGSIAVYQGDWNAAIDAFTRAIEKNPNMASAYQRRGEVYGHINDSENEISDLKRAAELGYTSQDDSDLFDTDDSGKTAEKTAQMSGAEEENFKF